MPQTEFAVELPAELDRLFLEARLVGGALQIAGALVHEPDHEIGQPAPVGGVLRRPTEELHAHGDRRTGVLLDQPRVDPERIVHVLDVEGIGRNGKRRGREDGGDDGTKRSEHGQDGLFGSGDGSRWPVTERRMSRYLRATALTSATVTAAARSGQCWT